MAKRNGNAANRDDDAASRTVTCGFCGQTGHNIRGCKQRQKMYAEFAEELEKRETAIEQAKREHDETKIKMEKEKKEAIERVMADRIKHEQANWVKATPALCSLVTGSLTFLGSHFDQIPYAKETSQALLYIVPALIVWVAAERIRGFVLLGKATKEEARLLATPGDR